MGPIYKLYTKQYFHTGLTFGAHIQIIYKADIIMQGWSLVAIYKLYTKQYYHTGLKFGAHIQIIYKAILSYRAEIWCPSTNNIQSNIIIQGWSLGPIYKLYTKQYYHTGLQFGAHIQIIYKAILSYRAEIWGPSTNNIQSNIIIQGWSWGPIYKLYTKQYYHTGLQFGAHLQIIYKTILSHRAEVWGTYTNYIQSNIIIQGWSLGPIYKLYTKQCYHTGLKYGAHIQIIYKAISSYRAEVWWPIYKLHTKQYYQIGLKFGVHLQIIYKAILSYRAEVWGPYTNYIQSNIIIHGWSLGPIYKLYTKQYYHTGLKFGAHIQIIYNAILSYRAEVWGPNTNYIQSNIIIQGWSLGPKYKLYTKQYCHTGQKFGAHIQIIYKAKLSYRAEVWGPYTNYIQSNIIIQGWSLGPIYKLYTKQYYHAGLELGAHLQIIYKAILSYRAEVWGPYTNYIQSNIIYKLYTKQYYHTGLKFGAHIQIIYKAILSYRAEVWGPYTNYIQSNIIIQGWSLGPIYKLYTKQYYHTGLKFGAHIQIIYKAILSYRAEVWGPYTNYIQSNIIIQGWSFGAHIQIIYKAILSYRAEVWGPYTNYIQSNIIIQGCSLGPDTNYIQSIFKLYTKQYYHTGLKFGAHIQIIYKAILSYRGLKFGAHIQIIYKAILSYRAEVWGPYNKLYTKQYYHTGLKFGAHIQIIYKAILSYRAEVWGPYTNNIQSNIIIQGWSLGPIYKLYTKQYYHTGLKFGAHIQIIYKAILSYRAEVWGPYTNYIQSNIIIQGWSLGPIYKLYTKQYYHTGLKFGAHIQIIYKAILSYRAEVWGPYTNYIQSNIIIQGWSLGPIYKLYTKQYYHTGLKYGAHIQIIYKAILSYRDEVWGPYTNYIQSNIIIQGWSLGPIYKLYTKQYYHTGLKFGAHIQIIYKGNIIIQGWSLGPICKLYTKQYYHTGLKFVAHIPI